MKRLLTGLGIGAVGLTTMALIGCGGSEEAVILPAPAEDASDAASPDGETTDPASGAAPTTPAPSNFTETPINPPQTATLQAQQADAQINLRSQPTVQANASGYGLVGDPVQLLKAAEGAGGLTWYYVKFNESGAEGWIRGDFINTSGTASSPNAGAGASIDSFSTDELFAVGGGGCGMTLWPQGTNSFVFFNGLPDTAMWMKLDGKMTQFRRTAASGPEFYGQAGSQSFVSLDGAVEVNVKANTGSEVGYEAVNVEQGTLQLKDGSGMTEMSVVGDAGC